MCEAHTSLLIRKESWYLRRDAFLTLLLVPHALLKVHVLKPPALPLSNGQASLLFHEIQWFLLEIQTDIDDGIY